MLEVTAVAAYTEDMKKEDLDPFVTKQPFQPFEIRLVDGQRFRFTSLEEFVVGRTAMAVLIKKDGTIAHINMGLISTARPIHPRRKASGDR